MKGNLSVQVITVNVNCIYTYIRGKMLVFIHFFFFSSASTAALRNIKKHQAIEMAFTLFPLLGAKVKNLITVPLPWVHPLKDGKGGSKKLGKNFNPSEGY